MMLPSTKLTRRSLLAVGALAVAAVPRARQLPARGYDRDRRRAYEALVDALAHDGRMPESPGAGDRLAALYRGALPRRRAEIDEVLDALAAAGIERRPPTDRLRLLRKWADEGAGRRVLAARALALAAASHGPADRPLTVTL